MKKLPTLFASSARILSLTLMLLSMLVACTSGESNSTSDLSNEESNEEPKESAGTISSLSNILPIIADIPDDLIDHRSGANLDLTPVIENETELDGELFWSKDYGPDDIFVNPQTGRVTWDIKNTMPSESFHVGLIASSLNAHVPVSFIVHAGVEEVITMGEGGDYSTFKAALKNLQSGGTLVVLDGTYSGDDNLIGLTPGGNVQHPPSGSVQAFTNIMAKDPGKAILKDGAYVYLRGDWPRSYITFKGLHVQDNGMAVVGYGEGSAEDDRRHHHIKFIRNCAEGNDSASPFNAFRSDYILFENNCAMGGGRYKFTSYQAENILWRRNVARYDRGPVHNEPKGTYSVYTTMNAQLSNNIAVDGDNPDFVMQGSVAGEFTTPTTSGPTRAKFNRNIQLNSAFLFGNMDEQISNGSGGDSDVQHTDVVSWDVKPGFNYVMSWGSSWLNHMTMGEIEPRDFADQFFFGYHNNTRGITNSILHNFSNGDMFYSLQKADDHFTIDRLVEKYGADTLNITGFDGELIAYDSDVSNITSINPIYSHENPNGALRYITRIEESSSLSGMATDGQDMGATVMTFLGNSGTFYGEEGFDTETNIPMWPFPSQTLFKEKFAQYTYTGNTYTGSDHNRVISGTGTIIGERGFAVEGQTLTNYIWGYLGNTVPPFNLSAVPGVNSVKLMWSASAANEQSTLTHYKIYQLLADEKILKAEVAATTRAYTLADLPSATAASFAVTAVRNDGQESGYAYALTVSPQ